MVFSDYFMSGFVCLNSEAVGIQRKNLISEAKNTFKSYRLACTNWLNTPVRICLFLLGALWKQIILHDFFVPLFTHLTKCIENLIICIAFVFLYWREWNSEKYPYHCFLTSKCSKLRTPLRWDNVKRNPKAVYC